MERAKRLVKTLFKQLDEEYLLTSKIIDVRFKKLKRAVAGTYVCDAAIRWYHQNRPHLVSSDLASALDVAQIIVDRMGKMSQLKDEFGTTEYYVKPSGHLVVFIPETVVKNTTADSIISHAIIFEDESCIAVNKKHNYRSVPGHELESIQTDVRKKYPEARMVHRLDFETSGIIVIALTKAASQSLNDQFRKKTITKTYIAVCDGEFAQDEGIISSPIGPDPEQAVKQVVDHENGKPCETHWKVLEKDAAKTRVQLKPITGRTHQLRVHMDALGHAIRGDSLYGIQSGKPERLHLHAQTLEFKHPVSKESIKLHAPCPF